MEYKSLYTYPHDIIIALLVLQPINIPSGKLR